MDSLPHMRKEIEAVDATKAQRGASGVDVEKAAKLAGITPYISGRGDRSLGDDRVLPLNQFVKAPPADYVPD